MKRPACVAWWMVDHAFHGALQRPMDGSQLMEANPELDDLMHGAQGRVAARATQPRRLTRPARHGVDEPEIGLHEEVLRTPARAQPRAVLARAARHPQACRHLCILRCSAELLLQVCLAGAIALELLRAARELGDFFHREQPPRDLLGTLACHGRSLRKRGNHGGTASSGCVLRGESCRGDQRLDSRGNQAYARCHPQPVGASTSSRHHRHR